jgi:hypothetical protein
VAPFNFEELFMSRPKHSNKDVEAALKHAESSGWTVKVGGHWGFLYCPFNDAECRCGTRCKAGIWSSPKNPGNHAKQLREVVDGCTTLQKKSAQAADEEGEDPLAKND